MLAKLSDHYRDKFMRETQVFKVMFLTYFFYQLHDAIKKNTQLYEKRKKKQINDPENSDKNDLGEKYFYQLLVFQCNSCQARNISSVVARFEKIQVRSLV